MAQWHIPTNNIHSSWSRRRKLSGVLSQLPRRPQFPQLRRQSCHLHQNICWLHQPSRHLHHPIHCHLWSFLLILLTRCPTISLTGWSLLSLVWYRSFTHSNGVCAIVRRWNRLWTSQTSTTISTFWQSRGRSRYPASRWLSNFSIPALKSASRACWRPSSCRCRDVAGPSASSRPWRTGSVLHAAAC